MDYSLTINQQDLAIVAGDIADRLESVRSRIQMAMGEQFKDIVVSNFGPVGIDRPYPWAPLSDWSAIGRKYIQKVGRPYATLHETGKLLSKLTLTNELEASRVSLTDDAECPYATRHHWGDTAHHLPMRRVFPIKIDGSITDYTHDAVMHAAVQELQEALK